jgi:L-iditol 2-dehydrogenase
MGIVNNQRLCLIGKDKFIFKKTDMPEVTEKDDVLIKVHACGICGTDTSYIHTNEHTEHNCAVLGHEFTGEVVKYGQDVVDLSVGERIIAEAAVTCGQCSYCIEGNNNFCENVKFFGFPPYPGGYQNYIVIPRKCCYSLPGNLNSVYATLAEPLAVSLHSLNLSNFQYGMSAAVIGAGTIGLMLIKLLKHFGAHNIIVSEPIAKKRELAIKYGASIALDPQQDDVTDIINKQTNNHGVDKVFECAGKSEAIAITAEIAKSGGSIIMVGIPMDDKFNISHSAARKKGLSIKMVRRMRHTLEKAIIMLAEGFDISELLTHQFDPSDAENVMKVYKEQSGNIIKGAWVFGE